MSIIYDVQYTKDTNICLNMVCFIFSALTLDDEIRVIGNLINGFLRSISFGRDFEQQLSFYVESRAAFSNIDSVLIFLAQVANSLSS